MKTMVKSSEVLLSEATKSDSVSEHLVYEGTPVVETPFSASVGTGFTKNLKNFEFARFDIQITAHTLKAPEQEVWQWARKQAESVAAAEMAGSDPVWFEVPAEVASVTVSCILGRTVSIGDMESRRPDVAFTLRAAPDAWRSEFSTFLERSKIFMGRRIDALKKVKADKSIPL